MFPPYILDLEAHVDYQNSLEMFAFFMLTGVGSTLLLPETKGLTLEQLSNEDQERFVRGVKNPMVDNLAPPIIQA